MVDCMDVGFAAHLYLVPFSTNLDNVERGGRLDAESLALADGEVMDACMAADDFARCRDELAGGVGHRFALLLEVGVDEPLIVAAGDEADLLRVGLVGRGDAVLGGDLADARLGVAAEREEGARELLLGEAEEEVGLVLLVSAGRLRIQRPRSGSYSLRA